jgi:phosphopantothenoylcysteine decarboxylase/phosphopantothenate--cysteine ligase
MVRCIAWALPPESQDLLAHATAKRVRKGVPLLVGNIGPGHLWQDDNALLLVDAAGVSEEFRATANSRWRASWIAEIAYAAYACSEAALKR